MLVELGLAALAFAVLIGPLALAKWLLERDDRRLPPAPPPIDLTHLHSAPPVPRSTAHRRRSP